MPWFCAAVATNKDIESLFRGNEPEVFVLRFRAFSNTARDAPFYLMRGTDAFVPLL